MEPDKVLADPLYSRQLTALPAGESLLWALAKQEKAPDLRYPAEDGTYEKAVLDAIDARWCSIP